MHFRQHDFRLWAAGHVIFGTPKATNTHVMNIQKTASFSPACYRLLSLIIKNYFHEIISGLICNSITHAMRVHLSTGLLWFKVPILENNNTVLKRLRESKQQQLLGWNFFFHTHQHMSIKPSSCTHNNKGQNTVCELEEPMKLVQLGWPEFIKSSSTLYGWISLKSPLLMLTYFSKIQLTFLK